MSAPPFSLSLMPVPVSVSLTALPTAIAGSQRILDLTDAQTISLQFSAVGVQIIIQGSLDWGATWTTLVPADNYMGVNPYRTGWWNIPPAMQADNVLIQAQGVGTGVIVVISYVELQYR